VSSFTAGELTLSACLLILHNLLRDQIGRYIIWWRRKNCVFSICCTYSLTVFFV